MSLARVKGLEVSIRVVADAEVVDVHAVKSANFTMDIEILREGYLGEPSDRRDEISRGSTFELELHLENADYLRFMKQVQDRAKRRAGGASTIRVDIHAVLNMPNGERPQIIIPDAMFGAFPLGVPERGGYVTGRISGEGEELDVVGIAGVSNTTVLSLGDGLL